MMKIFLGIIISVIIGYIWIWFVDHAFSHRQLKIRLNVRMFLHAFILVLFLFVYKYILLYFGWSSEYFLNTFTPSTVGLFVVYCVVLVLSLGLIYHTMGKVRMRNFIVVGGLMFLGVALGGYLWGVNIIVMYYLISAYAEEYLKFGTSNSLFLGEVGLERPNQTDLILFSVLMGLSFAGIENLFFVGQNIFISLQGGSGVSMSILSTGRGLVATLLHIVSTGLIAYIILYFQHIEIIKKKHISKFVAIVFALLFGVSLHALYNLSLYFQWKVLLLVLVIVSYFLLSFLLFRSDRMYDKG